MPRLQDKRTRQIRRRLRPVFGALILCGSLLACTPVIDYHGQTIDPDGLQAITPGQTGKTQVLALIGAPSSTGNFGEDVWYYVSEVRETKAFYAPEILDRKVLLVRFDETGVVDTLSLLDQKDGREFNIISRETSTAGQEITVMQQLLGNLGRFNEEE